ncbi:hypothetical protein Tco_0120221 [Tanacetum coccineum]
MWARRCRPGRNPIRAIPLCRPGNISPATRVVLPNVPCCQVRSDGQCFPNSSPCLNRAFSVWYDGFHPTEVANTVLATRSYSVLSATDASPYDISHLAAV